MYEQGIPTEQSKTYTHMVLPNAVRQLSI